MKIEDVEKLLAMTFRDQALLTEALTHRSYLNENPSWRLPHNERLEFLGDAVLELAVTRFLFDKNPGEGEGTLTLFRAALVNSRTLARVAEDLGIKDYLLVSRGEAQANGRATETILANTFEALIGAIYLDQGYEAAERFIAARILPKFEEMKGDNSYKDPKSLLQELIQAELRVTPTYRTLDESGPDHQKVFRVGVYFNDVLKGDGSGPSKQEAETAAAANLLNALQRNGRPVP
ncbi:MAG: ribonuclease III [Candidatus Colwellbacteria bacterium]|nr:ribonuclease III [Candidatus Colwellbacteria bacterium]